MPGKFDNGEKVPGFIPMRQKIDVIKAGTYLRIPLAIEAIMNDFRNINKQR